MKYKYDVFLSYNSKDMPAVEFVAKKLEKVGGFKIFLDKWNLAPGDAWQEVLEHALESSKTVAIFLGQFGIGDWHNEEIRVALERRVHNHDLRVIPVLLPGIKKPKIEEMPSFLQQLTWVDFRKGLDDPIALKRFVAGINGQPPGRL